jgi:galactose mutarotase-like enzyme
MTSTTDFGGERAYIIRDDTGAEAWIVPAVGNNCIAFRSPVRGSAGTVVAHVLSSPPSGQALREQPLYWGWPLMSPYPGRHDTPFTWQGRQHAIVANDRPGVALHGIVHDAAWEVLEAGDSYLISRFNSELVPDRPQRWPWPYLLTTTHRLDAGALTLELQVENRSDEVVPHLLGLHPYFPLRFVDDAGVSSAAVPLPTASKLAGEGSAARRTCLVSVAADELWMMRGGLGTGDILRLERGWDFRRYRAVAEVEAEIGKPPGPGAFGDDAALRTPRLPVLLFGKRAALRSHAAGTDPWEDGGVYSAIWDRHSGVEVTLAVSAGFGALALYCPPEQPYISLEPRSAVSNALTLAHNSKLSTGLWPLEPGGTWRAWARLSTRAAGR